MNGHGCVLIKLYLQSRLWEKCSPQIMACPWGWKKATGCLGQCGRTPRPTWKKAVRTAVTKRPGVIDLRPEWYRTWLFSSPRCHWRPHSSIQGHKGAGPTPPRNRHMEGSEASAFVTATSVGSHIAPHMIVQTGCVYWTTKDMEEGGAHPCHPWVEELKREKLIFAEDQMGLLDLHNTEYSLTACGSTSRYLGQTPAESTTNEG